MGVGVGYGGADAATGADDADGEVGGKVDGGGVGCRCRVFMLGWSEGEGVIWHGVGWLLCVVSWDDMNLLAFCTMLITLRSGAGQLTPPRDSFSTRPKGHTGDRYSTDAPKYYIPTQTNLRTVQLHFTTTTI